MTVSPPRTCGATSKGTHQPCRRFIRPEQLRCGFHGGKSPQAIRGAEARAFVAEATGGRSLDDISRRDVWVILADAVQRLDNVMTSEAMPPAQFVDLAERVVRVAKIAIDAGVAERQVQAVERRRDLESTAVLDVLTRTVDHVVAGLQLDAWSAEHVRDALWATAGAALADQPLPAVEPLRPTLPAAPPPAGAPDRPADAADLTPDARSAEPWTTTTPSKDLGFTGLSGPPSPGRAAVLRADLAQLGADPNDAPTDVEPTDDDGTLSPEDAEAAWLAVAVDRPGGRAALDRAAMDAALGRGPGAAGRSVDPLGAANAWSSD